MPRYLCVIFSFLLLFELVEYNVQLLHAYIQTPDPWMISFVCRSLSACCFVLLKYLLVGAWIFILRTEIKQAEISL
jgi:hypothetical protein